MEKRWSEGTHFQLISPGDVMYNEMTILNAPVWYILKVAKK